MSAAKITWKLWIVGLVTLAFSILLMLHAPFLNGPAYWKWPWRRLESFRYFPAMLLAAAPLIAALWVDGTRPARRIAAIGLVMVAMFATQIVHVAITVKPAALSRITYFVESPMSTSYFSDAIKTLNVPTMKLLADYPAYQRESFDMHSREKPPGPVLFFRAFLDTLGVSDRTAMISGMAIGLLATLCVPATYMLICVLLKDRDAAFTGSVMLALCPALILNFPMLDQVYAIVTCALVITWVTALRTGGVRWAILFGAILAGGCFVVYHFLVLGVFLGAASIAFVAVQKNRAGRVFQCSVAAVATFVLLYFATYALTGFNAIECFRAALQNQSAMLASFGRPYPKTILFDLTDFALGAAWIPWLLAIFALANRQIAHSHRVWGWNAIAQIAVLAITGLLQAETARVWCFLLPLLAIPAAAELSRWPRWMRMTVFAAMWVLMCLVGQNLAFMY